MIRNRMRLFALVIACAIFSWFSCGSTEGYIPNGSVGEPIAFQAGTLSAADSTYAWRHVDFSLAEDHSLESVDYTRISETVFPTVVLENEYLRVTLLPRYGGRILSIFYKPTGHELLYQNPLGTVFGNRSNTFYYNHLEVLGGIFPTFPEPEHGKTWLLPWNYELVRADDEAVSVRMWCADDIEMQPPYTDKFDLGRTDIRVGATVTLRAGRSNVEFALELVNTRDEEVRCEYWTCTTLAPGSEPGATATPLQSRIVAPLEQIHVMSNSYGWMIGADRIIDGTIGVLAFDRLAVFENWRDAGIAYAWPRMDGNWWGVVNSDNAEGVLRVADNARATPGLKFWTWGAAQSYRSGNENPNNPARPYIELWAGRSREFFVRSSLRPRERVTWTENYIPTVGLENVTAANENGAALIEYDAERGVLSAAVFSTLPETPLRLLIRDGRTELLDETSNFPADACRRDEFAAGALEGHTISLELKDERGRTLLEAERTF